ncbi:MAG: Uma2 family endonuclease [Acidobacteria bacterium]|nr:Uma2 family endonuclease [Acidobacteriota bacterium]
MATQPVPRFTMEEYLARERAAAFKSEYIHGEIVAMAGGTPRHSLIIGNMQYALSRRLEHSPCHVFNADLRVCVQVGDLVTYPDVTVLCGPAQFLDDKEDTLINPTVLVKVLSLSTRNYDRGEKARLYRAVRSLQEYLLIDPVPVEIEHGRRMPNGNWELATVRSRDHILELTSTGCSIPIEEIYRNVESYRA